MSHSITGKSGLNYHYNSDFSGNIDIIDKIYIQNIMNPENITLNLTPIGMSKKQSFEAGLKTLGLIISKKENGWLVTRLKTGVVGEGKTKKKALDDLFETERFIRISTPK